MRLVPLNQACGSHSCPQLFETDRGTVVVQGFLLSTEAVDVATSPGEALVEVPREVAIEALRRMVGEDRPAR